MGYNIGDAFAGILIGLILLIVVFLLLREFWCWYWKVNARLEKLKKIESQLSDLNKRLPSSSPAVSSGTPEVSGN